jgi:uncharacterized protein
MKAIVLADTHLRNGRWLPQAAEAHVADADVILHAGDVVDEPTLERLRAYAPVHAVLGNNDHELVGILARTLVVDLAGSVVAMIHDSGARAGRAGRLHRLFPHADVVVFGHSHIPVDEPGVGGQLLFNPGSPTQRRGQPHRTIGVLAFGSERRIEARIVPLD